MLSVCPACGTYAVEHRVVAGDPGWAIAVCASCGAGARFRRLPLFVVTGASGAGKTAVCRSLMHTLPECVVLESDILWGTIDTSGNGGLERYWDAWLRLIVNIHQAGRAVLLCGSVVPSLIEARPFRSCLATTHYTALTSDDVELERRLRARPAWRGCDDAFIAEHVRFNGCFRSNDDPTPPVHLIDTTHATVGESAEEVRRWVRARL